MTNSSGIPTVLSRAWFAASIAEFRTLEADTIVGRLASQSAFVLLPTQRDAWLTQIRVLQEQLGNLEGSLFLEFNIPQVGRRVDTILLVGPVVFVVEFKVG